MLDSSIDISAASAASHRNRESPQRASGIYICRTALNNEITASIVRLTDAFPDLHEHSAAQVSFLFRGNGAELAAHTPAATISRTPVHPAMVVYIPSGQRHRIQWHGTGEMLNLYFPESFAQEITEQTRLVLPQRSLLQSADVGVRGISQLILDEFPWTDGVTNTIIDHARFLIAVRLIRSLDVDLTSLIAGLLDIKRLQPAIDAMMAYPEKPFNLAELARLCNSSVFHFARSFKARFGSPPYAYQRTLRLQKAQSLLRESDLSIEAIAYAVGIEQATNFSRMFRRETGYSPKEFRNLTAQL